MALLWNPESWPQRLAELHGETYELGMSLGQFA